ncbi:MAG: polysaccharide deacetylase family protein [Candidatus Daviesbacteria bacterium]|nr:polysaccharide deacetylase family protein [Candidatus Daviesbacteria bacterium]
MNTHNPEFSVRRSLLKAGLGLAVSKILDIPLVKTVEAATNTLLHEDEVPVLNSSFLIYHELDYRTLKQNLLTRLINDEQPVSPETVVNVLNGLTKIPEGLKTFMVTCDDGLASQYGAVLRATSEIEKETGWFIPVTFFIMTKFDEPQVPIEEVPESSPTYNDGRHSYLTLGQGITILQERHILANHTVDHARLNTLPEGQRNSEIATGEDRLDIIYTRAGIARTVRMLAYPEGRYSGQLEFVQQSGFDLAFSTERTTVHTSNTRFHLGSVRADHIGNTWKKFC